MMDFTRQSTTGLAMEKEQLWRQYFIAGVASLGMAANGFCLGWNSPVLLKLTSEDTSDSPLSTPITPEEESWISSLLTLGAILGPFMGGFTASHCGRKRGMLICTLQVILGWILILTATNVAMIYVARFFWGCAVGMQYALTPMYCAEIATDNARGALGTFVTIFQNIGFLFAYSIGPYASYYGVAYAGLAVVILFDISFVFMPESPFYYLTKGNLEAAGDSLATIRGKSRSGVSAELEYMQFEAMPSIDKKAKFTDLLKRGNFKALYISFALVFFQQFSGINAVLYFMTNIFSAAGSDLDPNVCTIIVGVVQLLASVVTPFVVDRLGRKILWLISSCGTAVSLGLLGMYFIFSENDNPIAGSIGFLPILSLILYMVTYCLGLGPLVWAVIGELFSLEVKAIAAPLATAWCGILSFFVTKYFNVVASLGMYVVFWLFGVSCLLSFLFGLVVLPETKGKSFQEIQAMLRGEYIEGSKVVADQNGKYQFENPQWDKLRKSKQDLA